MESQLKKRKTVSFKFISNIIELHETNKKWLVEWSDKTRSWETYDTIKDLDIFQDFLKEIQSFKNKKQNIPYYIS